MSDDHHPELGKLPELKLPELPELPEFLKPSTEERVREWLKSLALLFFAAAAVVGPLVARDALDAAHDARAEAAATQTESRCRANLANNAQGAEGRLNAQGWVSLLRYVSAGADSKERADLVTQMDVLAGEYEAAQDQRDRADEICEDS